MSERLVELFRCEKHLGLFPRGMTRKACLRRQLDRTRAGKDWAPAQPFCAQECPLGAQTRIALADVLAFSCDRCGQAVIGEERCPSCATAGAVEARRAEAARGPVSTRLWTGEVPDVPLGPPPATSEHSGFRPEVVEGFAGDPEMAARARRRAREAAASSNEVEKEEQPPPAPPEAPANPEPPAEEPVQENQMPKGQRDEPCKGCGTTASRCKKSCPTKTGKPKARPAPARAEKRPAAPAATSAYVVPVGQLEDDDLVQSIADCRAELARRKDEAAARLRKLEAAIGEAA